MGNWRDKNTTKHRVLFASGVPVSRTRDAGDAQNELRTIDALIQANTLSVGDILRINCLYSCTNNANVKRATVRFGTDLATVPNPNDSIFDFNMASQDGIQRTIDIYIASATTANVINKSLATGVGNSSVTALSAINIAADMDVTFATNMATNGDVMSVLGYTIEHIKAD